MHASDPRYSDCGSSPFDRIPSRVRSDCVRIGNHASDHLDLLLTVPVCTILNPLAPLCRRFITSIAFFEYCQNDPTRPHRPCRVFDRAAQDHAGGHHPARVRGLFGVLPDRRMSWILMDAPCAAKFLLATDRVTSDIPVTTEQSTGFSGSITRFVAGVALAFSERGRTPVPLDIAPRQRTSCRC